MSRNTSHKTPSPQLRLIKPAPELEPCENEAAHFQMTKEGNLRLQCGATIFELHHDGMIILQNAHASIHLCADGNINVIGQQIHCHSKNDLVLAADCDLHLGRKR